MITINSGHIPETRSSKNIGLEPLVYQHSRIMPPTIILRDYPPDISAWAAASNQTSQIQTGNSTQNIPPVGFIIPLVVIVGAVLILLGTCS
jgi:hypothetical protein